MANSKSTKTTDKAPIYKQWWFWAVLVVVIGSVAIAAGNKNEPKKVGEVNESTSQSDSKPTQSSVFKVGDVISIKDTKVTVTSVERNYTADNEYVKPADGKEFVKVNIEIQNDSSKNVSYNALEWKVEDSNGSLEDYMSAMMASAPDAIGSGELVAGGKKVGSIVFEALAGDALKLHYKPLWNGEEIVIEL